MNKRKTIKITIVILGSVLAFLLILAWRISSAAPPDPTDPPSTGSTPSTSMPTQSAPTQTITPTTPTTPSLIPSVPTLPPTTPSTLPSDPSTVPTDPPTEPTEPSAPPTVPTYPADETFGIGMYTWNELENMSTEIVYYGPGRTSGGKRPAYPQRDQEKYGQYGANFIAPDTKDAYLTFDCGYEYTATDEDGNKYRVTERILDVLKEKNVKAVFFITMHYAKTQPDLVQRMIDEGHAVGNHSKTHPVMPTVSIERMINEVTSLHEYVLEHFGYEMHLFRPPTGAFSVQSLAVVQNLGYKNVHWSFAYADYDEVNQPDPEESLELIKRNHHNGAIYLLHAISTTNASILVDVIDFLQAEGYNLELFS